MAGDDHPGAPFEEQAALAELERLQRAIEDSQRRRRQATDAFDRFLRALDEPQGAAAPPEAPSAAAPPDVPPAAAPPDVPSAAPIAPTESTDLDAFPLEQPQPAAARPAPATPALPPRRETHAGEGTGPVMPAPPPAAPIGDRPVPAALAPPPGQVGGRGRTIAVVALLGVLLLAFVAVFMRPGTEAEVAAPPPEASARPAAPAAAAPAPAPAPAPAATGPAPRAELATLRRVWVRVLVDGERTVERELEGGVRIPLNTGERIAVRTGDAGAVRLAIGGKDQGLLGRDGEVVTRTFTLPPPPAPGR